MTTTRQYDFLDRLTLISNAPSASGQSPISFAYEYDSANQRTRRTEADASQWVYQYDKLGQVISGKKYWSDGTPVAGQQFEYGFDDIGNRTLAGSGGDQWGANLRYEHYSANNLNEYTQRTVPSSFDIIGAATNTATVTVNDQSAYRKGDYFRANYGVNNNTGIVYQSLTNLAVRQNGTNVDTTTNIIGNFLIPSNVETFVYDDDGNRLSSSLWLSAWNGENRCLGIESASAVTGSAKRKITFTYDAAGRRIQKISHSWNGLAYVAESTNKFIYDVRNLIAELDHTNGIIRSYIRGSDLDGLWGYDPSGQRQGSGGVGSLLLVKRRNDPVCYFSMHDGNGNVVAFANSSDGLTQNFYEYGPFGQQIRVNGSLARENPIRWSTKYCDDETGFIDYGARLYDPVAGRWLARDPAGEAAGLALFAFVGNTPTVYIDTDGRRRSSYPKPKSVGEKIAEKLLPVARRGAPPLIVVDAAVLLTAMMPPGPPAAPTPVTYPNPGEEGQNAPPDSLTQPRPPGFPGNPGGPDGGGSSHGAGASPSRSENPEPDLDPDVDPYGPPAPQRCKPPRKCSYRCPDGSTPVRTESFPGEFDGGCPKVRVMHEGLLKECSPLGPA